MNTDSGPDDSTTVQSSTTAADDTAPSSTLPDGHPLHEILRDMRDRYARGGEL